jgi:hypothetical protein
MVSVHIHPVLKKPQKQLQNQNVQRAKVRKSFFFFFAAIISTFVFVRLSRQKPDCGDKLHPDHMFLPIQGTQLPLASLTSHSWTPLPPPPMGFQEGGGILIKTDDGRREIWFLGGYPTDRGYVVIYNVDTQQWRWGPFLPWGLHHVFNAIFLSKTHLIVLGGIIHGDGKHRGNDAALIRPIGDETGPWQEIELPVGGIIACTPFDVGGKRWCYTGDQTYIDAPFRFFEIEIETLEIKQLPIPPIDTTHVALLHDVDRGMIYMAAGRKVDEGKGTLSKMYMFDLEKSEWLPEVLDIPYSDVESRTAVQLPGSHVALLLGGQSVEQNFVSDVVLQFHFDTRKFVWVEELPLQMFGFPAILLPNGKVMLASGAAGVGPKFMRMAWEWDTQDFLTTKQDISSYTGEGVQVTYAHCGTIVVTRELQQKVVGGNTTIPAKWCHEEETAGPGNVHLPDVLTVYFLRDEKMHSITCDGLNSCKLGP